MLKYNRNRNVALLSAEKNTTGEKNVFEGLTACLSDLNTGKSGEWIIDRENDGTSEHPLHFPFVDYSDVARRDEHEIYNIVDVHPEPELTNYQKILERNGIERRTKRMENAEVSKLDAQCVMALLVGAVRADRFCEGTFKGFIDNGCIFRWIERLKEIES